MANLKQYAYFLKGNKIAIVENDITPENDPTSRDYGPGARSIRYKSPTEDVTSGLEIEYAYSPKYTLGESELTPQVNQFYINGWTVKDGYLTFLRSSGRSVPSWDASPYSAVADDEYIVVRGSSRWNGLHKIKDGATDGTLQTYTRVNKSVPRAVGSSSIDIAAEADEKSLISANNGSGIWLNAIFSSGDYIFVSGSAEPVNNGFWKIDSVADDAGDESNSGIYIKNRYYCNDSENLLSTEGEDTTINTTATANESITIYRVYRDFCYILADVNTLNDEADELPVPDYLSKAVVYFVKAKMSEDKGDFKSKEYFMKEFKQMIERKESSNIWGARRILPSSNAIR